MKTLNLIRVSGDLKFQIHKFVDMVCFSHRFEAMIDCHELFKGRPGGIQRFGVSGDLAQRKYTLYTSGG